LVGYDRTVHEEQWTLHTRCHIVLW